MYDTPAENFNIGPATPAPQPPAAPAVAQTPPPPPPAQPAAPQPSASDPQQRQSLLTFSREASDAFLYDSGRYVELIEALERMLQGAASVSQADELMDARRVANSIAEGQAVLSRTIGDLRSAYASYGLEADDPILLRPLMQEILESCVLIANTSSLHDMAELPLYDLDTLIDVLGDRQLHAWLLGHASPETAQLPPAVAPQQQPVQPHPAQPAASPYPQSSPYPTVESDDAPAAGFAQPSQRTRARPPATPGY